RLAAARLPPPAVLGVAASPRPRPPDARARPRARLGRDLLEAPRGGDRKTRLDHVHPQVLQRVRHLELLGQVHAGPGALLPVPQRRVEDDQAFVGHGWKLRATTGHTKNKAPGRLRPRAGVSEQGRQAEADLGPSPEEEEQLRKGEEQGRGHGSARRAKNDIPTPTLTDGPAADNATSPPRGRKSGTPRPLHRPPR